MVEVDSGTLCCEDIGVLGLEFSNFDINVTYRVSSKTVYTWLFALLSASSHAKCKSWDVF